MEPAIKSVRRARRHDRAVEVEQRRRDAGREAIGQAALVVGAFVDQRQMIPPASAGARSVIERPEINGAATEKAYFAEHAVDPHTGQAPKRRNDRLEQRTQEFIGRTEHADAPACERPIDRQHGQERSLAPSPAAHKDDAAVGMSVERLDLATDGAECPAGRRAARKLCFAGLKVREGMPSGSPPTSKELAPTVLPASTLARATKAVQPSSGPSGWCKPANRADRKLERKWASRRVRNPLRS